MPTKDAAFSQGREERLPTTARAALVPPQKILSGLKKEWVELGIRLTILKVVLQRFKSPGKIMFVLRTLDQHRRQFLGESRIKKIVEVDQRYFWDLYVPGWPSKAFTNFIKGEVNRIAPLPEKANRLSNAFIAITKKCSLQCDHCFEWEALNKKEALTADDLNQLVGRFQEQGIGQIQLTGGEPMLRLHDMLEVLRSAKPETDFWLLSAGQNFTAENAQKLKDAGLTGVVISLDHFDEKAHNTFRGSRNAFEWVKRAVANAIASGLVAGLSVCVTKDFAERAKLLRYMEMAKEMGVAFVQLLEPKAVGHYKGKEVALSQEQERMLEQLFLDFNYHKAYSNYPVLTYHGYYQRRIGCFAAGNRNVYVDTDGDYHACPFCQSKQGSALEGNMLNALEEMRHTGCHAFKNATI